MVAGPGLRRVVFDGLANCVGQYLEQFSKENGEGLKRCLREWVAGGVAGGIAGELGEALVFSRERMEGLVGGLSRAGYDVVVIEAVLRALGRVGGGRGLFYPVFEQGLEVDSLLGLPFYPGSTLKGAARGFCEAVLGHVRLGEGVSVCDLLFGSSATGAGETGLGVGLVGFLDAYPIGCLRGEGVCSVYYPDVTTPHYYKGGEPVEKELDVSPTPLLGLSVSPGLVFKFVAYGRNNASLRGWGFFAERIRGEENVPLYARSYADNPLMIAGFLLVEALNSGFAARSAKGYNVFRVIDREERERLEYSVVRLRLLTGA